MGETMTRPKRSAAIKAQASVSKIGKNIIIDDEDVVDQKGKDIVEAEEQVQEAESPLVSAKPQSRRGRPKKNDSVKKPRNVEEPEEWKDSKESEIESESEVELESESDLELAESEEDPQVKLGRPRKGEKRTKRKYPTGVSYISLKVFKPIGVGPLNCVRWQKAINEARPLKRFKAKAKEARMKLARPPTEIIRLKTIPELAEAPFQVKQLQGESEIVCRKITAGPKNAIKCSMSIQKNVDLSFDLELYSKFYHEQDKIVVLRGGFGAISALNWCKCCGKFLISSSYPSIGFKDYFAEKQSFENYLLVWKFDPTTFSVKLWLRIKHNFGVARQIEWFPFRLAQVQKTFAVCFGDGSIRIVTLPNSLKQQQEGSECDFSQLDSSRIGDPDSHYTSFAWAPNPDSANIFLSGSLKGEVCFWNLNMTELKPTFRIDHGQSPITSLSWCHNDTNLLAVGNHGQSMWVFDLQKPFEPFRLFTALSSFPLVRWTDNGLVFGEHENLLRIAKLTPGEDIMKAVQFNLTQLDGMITDYAISPLHNIAMVACGNGKLVLQASMPEHDFVTYACTQIQHKFKGNTVHIDIGREPLIETPANSLYDLKNGITKAAWCISEMAPGVVAAGCGSGLIIIQALDQFLLVE